MLSLSYNIILKIKQTIFYACINEKNWFIYIHPLANMLAFLKFFFFYFLRTQRIFQMKLMQMRRGKRKTQIFTRLSTFSKCVSVL